MKAERVNTYKKEFEAICDSLIGEGHLDPSLSQGGAGVLLFLASARCSEVWNDSICDYTRQIVNYLISSLNTIPMEATLYGGVLGVLSSLEQSSRELGLVGENSEVLSCIDQVLNAYFSPNPGNNRHYDLINGVVGAGVLAAQFYEQCGERKYMDQCQKELLRRVGGSAACPFWPTGTNWVSPPVRKDFPHGYMDLGIAHGIPGIWMLARQFEKLRIGHSQFLDVCCESAKWIYEHARIGGSVSLYPSFYYPGSPLASSRLGWCYGDLSLGYALAFLGESVAKRELQDWGIEVCLKSCLRKEGKNTDVADSGLCHGRSGLVVMYEGLFQEFGNIKFRDSATYWMDECLRQRKGNQYRGFYALRRPGLDVEQPMEITNETGLLMGTSGVGLCLAFLLGYGEKWRNLLLL